MWGHERNLPLMWSFLSVLQTLSGVKWKTKILILPTKKAASTETSLFSNLFLHPLKWEGKKKVIFSITTETLITTYNAHAEWNTLNNSSFTGNMHSLGWSFSTPRSITGLKGSCVVIPCKFTYSTAQPNGLQVIWYMYQPNAYPAVFNERHTNVISKFNDRTSLIGSVADSNCSLKIDRLEMSHNLDRLYPWIDKNPITSYHSHDFSFYDKTTQIFVSGKHFLSALSWFYFIMLTFIICFNIDNGILMLLVLAFLIG